MIIKTENKKKPYLILSLIIIVMLLIFSYFYFKKPLPIIEPIQTGGKLLQLNNTILEFNKLLNI
jgi:hypothetical protein